MGDAGPCSPLPAEFSSTSNDARPREVTVLVTGFGVCICPTRSPQYTECWISRMQDIMGRACTRRLTCLCTA